MDPWGSLVRLSSLIGEPQANEQLHLKGGRCVYISKILCPSQQILEHAHTCRQARTRVCTHTLNLKKMCLQEKTCFDITQGGKLE